MRCISLGVRLGPQRAGANPTALLKGEKGVHAASPIISIAVVEDRLVRMVVSDFRSEQPFREVLVVRERLDRYAPRDLIVAGADGRPVREPIGRVVIPLQPGIECETRINRVADISCHPSPRLTTAC